MREISFFNIKYYIFILKIIFISIYVHFTNQIIIWYKYYYIFNRKQRPIVICEE